MHKMEQQKTGRSCGPHIGGRAGTAQREARLGTLLCGKRTHLLSLHVCQHTSLSACRFYVLFLFSPQANKSKGQSTQFQGPNKKHGLHSESMTAEKG